MQITDIFGDTIEVTDFNAAIKQANASLGFAQEAAKQAGGYPNVRFTEKYGVTHTIVAYHSHMVKKLITLLPVIEKPEWLFIGGFPACYSYCDMRKEVKGDYKGILRLFYSPLRIEITAANKKVYPDVLKLAEQHLKQLQLRCNEPLTNASGQETHLSLSSGPDVVIVK